MRRQQLNPSLMELIDNGPSRSRAGPTRTDVMLTPMRFSSYSRRGAAPMSGFTVHRFTTKMIRQNNLTEFLHRFDLYRPEAWHYLPQLFGRLCLSYEGFELNWSFHPDLRRFWRVFHECWPHWTLFLDLGQQDLRVMTLGCLKSFHLLAIPGQDNGAVFYDRDELDAFIESRFPTHAGLLRAYAWHGTASVPAAEGRAGIFSGARSSNDLCRCRWRSAVGSGCWFGFAVDPPIFAAIQKQAIIRSASVFKV